MAFTFRTPPTVLVILILTDISFSPVITYIKTSQAEVLPLLYMAGAMGGPALHF